MQYVQIISNIVERSHTRPHQHFPLSGTRRKARHVGHKSRNKRIIVLYFIVTLLSCILIYFQDRIQSRGYQLSIQSPDLCVCKSKYWFIDLFWKPSFNQMSFRSLKTTSEAYQNFTGWHIWDSPATLSQNTISLNINGLSGCGIAMFSIARSSQISSLYPLILWPRSLFHIGDVLQDRTTSETLKSFSRMAVAISVIFPRHFVLYDCEHHFGRTSSWFGWRRTGPERAKGKIGNQTFN